MRLSGYDVVRQRGRAVAQIGAVLEGSRNVYWRLSAWENLLYFGRLRGRSGAELKARAEWLLRHLDLWERRNDLVREFSRGMQQKIAIASALIADPPILLLDEPIVGLDVHAARTVKGWVRSLAEEDGKTVLLTTHQLDVAQQVCDRVAIMREGRLLADQPVSELLGRFRQDRYRIRVQGRLDGHLDRFPGMAVTNERGDAILSGAITEQARLHEVLGIIRELGLPLVSVERVAADLEEVFVRLVEGED